MRSLRNVSIFSEVSSHVLTAIANRCRWHTCDAGEVVISHCDASRDIFFLTEGHARVIVYAVGGKTVAFRDMAPGDVFGEMSAIDGKPRSASIEAQTRCVVAALPADQLWTILEEEPSVVRALLLHLVAQVRVLTRRILEFSTLTAADRIRAELLRLAGGHERRDGSALIDPAPHQAEIAEKISSQREAVAREFGRLKELGLIERKGSGLLIKDVARLKRMLDEVSET
ncbi:MAG: Crp/Fnr family transcriptional regulator [Hyphomicrobiaceae bacterium]